MRLKVLNRRLFDGFGSRVEEVVTHKAGSGGRAGGTESRLWRTFFKFLRVILPYWDKILLIVGLVCVNMTVSVLTPWIGKVLLDDALPQRDWMLFTILVWADIGMAFGLRFISLPQRFFTRYIDLWVLTELRTRFFEHQLRLSMTYMEGKPVGEHVYRANNDVNAVMFMITDLLPLLLESIFEFFLVMALLSYLDWRLTLVVTIFIIPYSSITHWVATLVRRWDKQHREKQQQAMSILQDGVAGKMVVKTFARRRHEVHKYIAAEIAAFRVGMKKRYAWMVKGHLVGNGGLAPWLMNWGMKAWFYKEAILGHISYGSLVPVFSYMNRFRNPIQRIVNLIQQLRISMVPAERLMETLELLPGVVNQEGARKLPRIKGEVRLEGVHFGYEQDVPILKGLDLSIEPGQRVAFVGHSGTGKSTIAKLLMRMYDPAEGKVLIDGVDLREVRQESVQRQLGLVFQETFLFIGSVRDNILFANPRATETEIWDALRRADLEEFVRELPDGLDTDLQEGTSLSGGQKQRLGIARALVRDPKLLILDEPTSSLDSDTEQRVMSTLKKAMEGRTTIMISHRLPTIVDADVIHVLDEGRIVESGSHAQLMARGGHYRDLYTLYFKGKIEGE
jgi:ABC-type multidrug transport system fused ATPase/permease subunit